MRSILELCVAMDTFAQSLYYNMAASASNPDLAQVFQRMSLEEAHHVTWWKELLDAWDQGLVPDVINDTDGLTRHMEQLYQEMQVTAPDDFSNVPDDVKLDIAARIEFFLLDPIFGELLDLAEPGGARNHRSAYARHLERIIGAIESHYSRSDLARFLAHVLRRAWRDNLALATFATRDPLTGLYNRRGLMTHLTQWASWAQRYERPLGILLVDVDDFKSINDTYGHSIGDVALKAAADALETAVRGSDMVARYGGDEFAIVAPEADEADLEGLAQRLLDQVRGTRFEDGNRSAIELTISVGGAVVAPSAAETRVDVLLATADRALYEAKHLGKDRAAPIAVYSASQGAAS